MEDKIFKRTPELEDYMVEEALSMVILGSRLTEFLSEELYKQQKKKVLSKKDLCHIIAQVVLQYDAQFGINRYKDDPVMSRKIYERIKEMEANGEVEKVHDDDEEEEEYE